MQFPATTILTLWQALTHGVLLMDHHDGACCTAVGSPQPFAGLFSAQEASQRIAAAATAQRLWTCDYGWSETARAWVVAQIETLPAVVLQQAPEQVFGHPIAPEHRHDSLLAYAWWGNVPSVFHALQARRIVLDEATWGGRALSAWIADARAQSHAPQHRWACEMHAVHEIQTLGHAALFPLPVTKREARRL